MLATCRHHFLSERCVTYVRDDGGKNAASALNQPGWGRVKLALLCRRTVQDGADLDGRRRLKDREWHGDDTVDDRWRRSISRGRTNPLDLRREKPSEVVSGQLTRRT